MQTTRLLILAVVTSGLCGMANAQIVSFSHSLSLVQAESVDSGPTSPYRQSSFSPAGGLVSTLRNLSSVEGNASGQSESGLALGALRASASASSSVAGGVISGFARADFGDSFRTVSGGGPFNWTSGDTATFTLDLSGLVQKTGTGQRFNYSSVGLTVLEPGALDAYARWLTGDAPFSEWGNRIITQSFFSLAHDDPFPGEPNILTFPDQRTITFNPNGDFDWVASLVVESYINGDFASSDASVTSDFFNTAQFGYAGPAGTTTLSGSGLFPGTTAVPEPSVLAICLIAGITLLQQRRTFGRPT